MYTVVYSYEPWDMTPLFSETSLFWGSLKESFLELFFPSFVVPEKRVESTALLVITANIYSVFVGGIGKTLGMLSAHLSFS